MKKLLVILTGILLVAAFSLTVDSCKKKEKTKVEQVFEQVENMIEAAKSDDVQAFANAVQASDALGETLTDEEAELLDQMLEEKISEEDSDLVEAFMMEHQFELMLLLGGDDDEDFELPDVDPSLFEDLDLEEILPDYEPDAE